MNKYYVEIWDNGELDRPYILQSKWYDTEEEAMEFIRSFQYLDNTLKVDIMTAEFGEEEIYGDIRIHKQVI